MSYADELFINTCKAILDEGTSTEGEKVRPHWEDGTPAYTIKKFGIVNRYDLRKEFPAITLRRTAIKSAFDEVLWIYQRKSNDIKDLKPHIWDEWADENGSIGKAYGYQVGNKFTTVGYHYDRDNVEHNPIILDQMDTVLYTLKNTPFSRRIMISLWDVDDLNEMNLQPCCWSVNFNVTDEGGDKLVLNMVLNQRSADVLAANNWNVCQYALLLMMVAQVSNMIPGELIHVITDAHIYDRHVPIVKELIERPTYHAPKVTLNPKITDFYEFTSNDVIVTDYQYNDFTEKIPIAV